ncbi:MAG: outer membrane beta-barrel family protein [Chitinophagaceae bacterium]
MRFASFMAAWVLVCVAVSAQAQRVQYGSIKGTVLDSAGRGPLESATVSVFLSSDTSLVGYGITNKKGEFLVKEIPVGKPCRFTVSYKGLQTVLRDFIIQSGSKELVFDSISLGKSYAELEEVTVVAQKSPVVIKDDTTEFNASAFKTMPNAVAEDVIKQMPGFDIDKDGNITFNGKKISKITVEGKDFFGGDPVIALKNLPKEVIDKIQVMDNKTKEQQLTKISDGNEDKALNIVLQKDKKKGWFGRFMGGYGSDERYEAGAMLNYFNKALQLSIIGTANNTSRMNFSNGGSNLATGVGGGGIASSKSMGVNYGNEWNKKLRLAGSYFWGNNKNTNIVSAQRQNILPDTTFFYNSGNTSVNENNSHRFSLNAEWTIDTLTNMSLNSSFNLNNGNSQTSNTGESKGTTGKLINTTGNTNTGKFDNTAGTADFFIGRRLRKRGRSVSLSANINFNQQTGQNDNIGQNLFYKDNVVDSTEDINQRSYTSGKGNNISVTATYTEPVIKDVYVNLRYNYRTGTSTSDKQTFRYNPVTSSYDIEDTLYTNAFRNTTSAHNPSVNISYNYKNLRAGIGAGVQWLTQDNYSVTKDSTLHQYNVNFTPSANIGYKLGKTGNINLFYNGRSQQPSIQQLQPVPDNSNPLYIRLGNPDLKQSFFHNVNVNIQKSNGFAYWNGSVGLNVTNNQIVTETYYDDVGRQISRPININGNYGFSGNVNYSRSWRKKNWTFRVNLGSSGSFNNTVNITNKVQNTTKSYNFGQSVGFNYTYTEKLIVSPSFFIRYSNASYSIQQSQDPEYITKGASLNISYNWLKRLLVENNVNYNYNSRTAPGIRKGVTMWNASIGWFFFNKKQGTLKFTVYDLLKQNIGVNRTISQTYIEDRQTQVLQRYFLISFTYNLRKFG